jgi:hypothetical protein
VAAKGRFSGIDTDRITLTIHPQDDLRARGTDLRLFYTARLQEHQISYGLTLHE